MMKLHLGCGSRHIPGLFHIDAQNHPHVDRVGPIEDLSFLEAGTVSLIYASHVLEHLDRASHRKALEEWHRVLCDGGVLRLAVPDFVKITALYMHYRDIDLVIGLLCGGQRDEFDYHKMVFDERSLSKALYEIGFSTVRRWDWQKTSHAHVEDYSQTYLPHRDQSDKESGILVSLNIEAVK